MLNFLSSIRHDYTCAQIEAVEDRISKLNTYIKECKERMYELDREMDHYEDQLTKSMEKRLDLIETMDAIEATSTRTHSTQKLA